MIVPKKKTTKPLTPLQTDILDAIREGCARGEVVKLDDIVSAVRIKYPGVGDAPVSKALRILQRAKRVEWLPKRHINGNVRKVWGWTLRGVKDVRTNVRGPLWRKRGGIGASLGLHK